LQKPIIQIAGIVDQQEADDLIALGIHWLGFPLRLPVNKEDISEEETAKIIKTFPKNIQAVIITYQNNAQEINQFCQEMGSNTIQLHGEISTEELTKLRKIAPKLTIFKSLVTGKNSLENLITIIKNTENLVDAYITDSYNPKTGATGATGLTHDWELSRALVKASSKPVILAGGLNEKNVYDAIITVKPAGVDTHTGIEDSNGRKNLEKTKLFLTESKRAFKTLQN
jgi:phosphoribosylanthranilate isomerase